MNLTEHQIAESTLCPMFPNWIADAYLLFKTWNPNWIQVSANNSKFGDDFFKEEVRNLFKYLTCGDFQYVGEGSPFEIAKRTIEIRLHHAMCHEQSWNKEVPSIFIKKTLF